MATEAIGEPRALHYSKGKEGVDQLPPQVLMEVGKVFTYGAQKYARNNWMNGTDWSQFVGSDLRHIYKWLAGEDYDNCDGSEGCTPDADFCKVHSRTHHLAQHIWNGMCLLFYQLNGLGTDDRSGTVVRQIKSRQEKGSPERPPQCPTYDGTGGGPDFGLRCQLDEGHDCDHQWPDHYYEEMSDEEAERRFGAPQKEAA